MDHYFDAVIRKALNSVFHYILEIKGSVISNLKSLPIHHSSIRGVGHE